MRTSPLLILALFLAIASAAVFAFWHFPNVILNAGIEPTGVPLREIYHAQTVLDLPRSIQELMKYQFPLAILLSLAVFGTIYYGLSIKTGGAQTIAICCLVPIAGIVWFLPILLSLPISLGLLIWLIRLYLNSNRALFIPCFYCFALNVSSVVVVFLFINDLFGAITT
jgi:hypothetical protein